MMAKQLTMAAANRREDLDDAGDDDGVGETKKRNRPWQRQRREESETKTAAIL